MMGENPFLSDPNINKVRKALSTLDFLVVQDIFLTETAEFADVILPATTFVEKDGTYTNTDRRVQIGRKVLDPPGQARPDWQIIQDMSNRIGLPMDYSHPSEIFDELVSVMPNYAGLSYDNLGSTGKLYPNPDPLNSDGTIVLFDERFGTDDGLAHLVPAEWLPAKELPSEEYPFILNTGRLLEHWHTGSMTRRSFALDSIQPEPHAFLNPEDAKAMGIADGDFVRLTSRRGTIELRARLSHRDTPGTCFVPFHFREAAANLLTIDEIDPFGKIPEFKFCAVRIERAGSHHAARVDAAPAREHDRPARPAALSGHRGAGRQVPRSQPDPGADRHPAPLRVAAARGARHAGPRRAPAAVRDRGPDLVLPALPHVAAEGRAARGLPRPHLLAARLRRADRRDEGEVRRRRRDRDRRGLLPRALRHRAGRGRRRAPAAPGAGRRRHRRRPRRRARGARGAAPRRRAPPERPLRARGRALPALAPRAGRRAAPRVDRRHAEGLRPARHGRRRLPDGPEVGDRRRPGGRSRSTRSATPTSPSPGRSRTARSWPSSRISCSRGCCSGCS